MDIGKTSPRFQRILVIAIAICAALFLFGRPLWRCFDIYFHEARTVGTIQHILRRATISYSYTVAGVSYHGTGYGGRLSSIQVGEPVEVRYSYSHPSFSALESPLVFPGQVAVAALFLGSCGCLAYRSRATRRERNI